MLNRPTASAALLTILVTLSAQCMAQTLDVLTHDAVVKCSAVGAWSLDQCGDMPIKQPGVLAARQAISKVIKARTRLLDDCAAQGVSYGRCDEQVNWQISKGIAHAMEGEGPIFGSAPATPQSSKQR